MNNNTTNKKKLELKKTAIANLTLSESQMRMVVGGNLVGESGKKTCQVSLVDDDGCGTRPTNPINKTN